MCFFFNALHFVSHYYIFLKNNCLPCLTFLGITDCDVQERIHRFVSKLDSIGIVYKYSADMLDEFMRLEAVAEQKEAVSLKTGDAGFYLDRQYYTPTKSEKY